MAEHGDNEPRTDAEASGGSQGDAGKTTAAGDAAGARTLPKTAVVLIHGMGEQRPMATLWGFVDAVWSTDDELVDDYREGIYAKPDTINDSFELRRVTTRYWLAEPKRRADFFEFYWAHLMRGNTLRSTVAWILGLFFRRPSSVPKGLKRVWAFGLFCLVAAIVFFAAAVLPKDIIEELLGKRMVVALGIVSALSGFFASRWLAPVAGDAARYFSPDPDNVEARQKVMRAGVEVIERLTRSGEYDRIIVVGHSLGTAIGLDILYQAFGRVLPAAWAQAHGDQQVAGALRTLEKRAHDLLDGGGESARDAYREAQRDYAAALRTNWRDGSAPWLVSDFVSLGSPLSKANVLIARDQAAFDVLKDRRQIPTSPPKPEQTKPVRFSFRGAGKTMIPHFAAIFAPTVWTNVFFPSRLIAFGDVISGPVAPLFGHGVRDLKIAKIGLRFRHNDYWRNPDTDRPPPWIETLRRAVNLRLRPEHELFGGAPPLAKSEVDAAAESEPVAEKSDPHPGGDS